MIEFRVPDLSCDHCVGQVTRALRSIDPGAEVDVDLQQQTVRVESRQDRAVLAAALSDAGYPPKQGLQQEEGTRR